MYFYVRLKTFLIYINDTSNCEIFLHTKEVLIAKQSNENHIRNFVYNKIGRWTGFSNWLLKSPFDCFLLGL